MSKKPAQDHAYGEGDVPSHLDKRSVRTPQEPNDMDEFRAKAKRDGERELRQMKAAKEPDELDRILEALEHDCSHHSANKEGCSAPNINSEEAKAALNQLLLKARRDELKWVEAERKTLFYSRQDSFEDNQNILKKLLNGYKTW